LPAEASALNVRALRRPKVLVPLAAALLLLLAAGGWWTHRQSRIRWAREVALPEAQRLWTDYEPGYCNVSRAYDLVMRAQRYIPQDREVLALIAQISRDVSIKPEPPGAAVYVREISAPGKDWRYLGTTPIEKVRVQDAKTPAGTVEDFFIDKYEVTSRQFQEFVQSGGAYDQFFRQLGWRGSLIHLSNFLGKGPVPAGSHQGMSPYGAYDMGGNVREWCWNQTSAGRVVQGGAWNDAPYMIVGLNQADAFDRSPRNGFRCARYLNARRIPPEAFAPYEPPPVRDYYREKPAADAVFEVYGAQYDYDKAPLNAKIEWRGEGATGSIKEKVTFDAAYGDERVTALLWLPRHVAPPYQAVLFFPGANVWFVNSSQKIDQDIDPSYIVKNGRAVICPIRKGTFERRFAVDVQQTPADSSQMRDARIQWVQDFRRCIDYLETRSDFDKSRLAYLGVSWGGQMAPLVLAVENRIKAAVLVNGGVNGSGRPEVNPLHFIPRAKQPTLMLNGKYDVWYPHESIVKAFHDLLGIPPEHKRLCVYATDHFVPRNELVKETLAWLDRYLGPVR
jgi:dienelactone hydrolase